MVIPPFSFTSRLTLRPRSAHQFRISSGVCRAQLMGGIPVIIDMVHLIKEKVGIIKSFCYMPAKQTLKAGFSSGNT